MKIAINTVLVVTLSIFVLVESNCDNVLVSLSPCKDYITGSSSTPASGCCIKLSSVIESQPRCLCTLFTGGGYVNKTRALELPTACKIQTPSFSICNSPSKGPSSAPPPPRKRDSSGSDSGNEDASHGSSIKLSDFLLLSLQAIAIYVSFFTTT